VRVRITLVATLVTGLAVLVAGSWLVRTVERSLTDRQENVALDRLEAVRVALEAGLDPRDVLVGMPHPDTVVQILTPGGAVISATPGIAAGGFPTEGMTVRTERVDSPGGRFEVKAASPLDPVQRGVDAVREGLWVSFPLLVAAVGALAWFLSGRALRPVELIRTEVEAISGSTLDRRVPVPRTGDEVASLARTMNAMLDRLEDASTRQQRFVADASHELRSPVAAIRTELEVAQRTAGPDEWPEVAERLLHEEARLEAVIEDLLLLASLDEGAGRDDVVVDVAELAEEEARRRAGGRHGERGDVVVEVDAPAPVHVRGSRMQLRRAQANLLDNAVRHARTTVRVSVHARDGRVRVLVDDDGPGIAEADRERAFERFTRLDEHRARDGSPGGSGLGLSLVRRIAERHQGRATIDTAPLGGARVVLDLPAAAAP
jgi:signal transduction histidine kinase